MMISFRRATVAAGQKLLVCAQLPDVIVRPGRGWTEALHSKTRVDLLDTLSVPERASRSSSRFLGSVPPSPSPRLTMTSGSCAQTDSFFSYTGFIY